MRNHFFVPFFKWSILTLLAAAFVSPLLVSSQYLFPFITTKTLFFRLIVECALVLYVIACLFEAEFRPTWKDPFVYCMGSYLLFATLASYFGINSYKSFWGTIERGEGLILLYHFFAWFMMLRGMLKNERSWQWMFHANSLITFLVSLYGIAQYFGATFVLFPGQGRIAATLGNASFFAAYMLFGVFASLRIILDRSQRLWVRVVYGVVCVLGLFALYLSETRGAILGLLGGIVLLSLLFVFKSKSSRVRWSSIGVGVTLLLLVAAVLVFRDTAFVRSHNTIYRIGSIVSASDVTKQSRLYAWDSSWKAFLDRPILGYGYEHYNIAFNKYFHPEIFIDQGSQIWFDRAHNTVFDILVTSGVFGLGAYLSIFGVACWVLWRRFREAPGGVVPYGILIALLAAYFFQNLFVFDTLPTYLWFFFIIAYISFVTNRTSQKEQKTPMSLGTLSSPALVITSLLVSLGGLAVYNHYLLQNKDYGLAALVALYDLLLFFVPFFIGFLGLLGTLFSQKLIFRYCLSAGLMLLCLVVIVPRTLVRPHNAARAAVYGLALQRQNLYQDGFASMRKAIGIGSNYSYEIRQKYAESAILALRASGPSDNDKKYFLSSAINGILENKKEIPQDVQNHLYLISLYNAYDVFESSILSQIYDVGEEALKLSPTRPQIYFGLGQAALSQGKWDRGIEYFKSALVLNPVAFESNWNLAAAYEIAGKREEAQKLYDSLREYGYDLETTEVLQKYIPVYAEARDYQKLKDVYEKLLKAYPDNVEYWSRLAAVYRELGNVESAIRAVTRAVELDPSLASDAEVYIKSLQKK